MDYLTQLLELGEVEVKMKKSSPLVPPEPPEPPFHAQDTTLETLDLFDETPRTPRTKKTWRDRDASYWARVRESVTPGVQKICAQLLHAYPLLIDGLNAGTLPAGGCRVVVRGQEHHPEDVVFSLKTIFAEWAETAASCHEEQRDLTEKETDDLDETIEILEWLNAANMGDHWADLERLIDGADGYRAEKPTILRSSVENKRYEKAGEFELNAMN